MREKVRRIIAARKRELITEDEAYTEFAALLGVDIRCDMGECFHAPQG